MAKGLYYRLAKTNLSRNRLMYLPYFIATALISSMFFIIFSVVLSKSVSNMSFGGTMVGMLTVGVVVMAIFTFCYMLYINSFLIKRRKKEFGLYGILGLEKRHVSRIILLENVMLNLSALAAGLLCGTVFGKLVFMALMAALKTAPGSMFQLPLQAYGFTAAIFFVIFIATTIYNLLQVHLANPINLIHGEKKGEKKVRFVIPLTIIGLLFVGGAYWFSITVKAMGMALSLFWPAVILVILGTHALFVAGSQFVLRALQKSSRFYYKARNFITISGLMHRLKENAAGLANICILSTMVIVTISSCCSLFFGQEEILHTQNPDDYTFTMYNDGEGGLVYDADKMSIALNKLAARNNVSIENMIHYEYLTGSAAFKDGTLLFGNYSFKDDAYLYHRNARIITQKEFAAVSGKNQALGAGEILILSNDKISPIKTLDINGKTYTVRGILTDTPFTSGKNSKDIDALFFVTVGEPEAQTLAATLRGGDSKANPRLAVVLNLSGTNEDKAAFAKESRNVVSNEIGRPANSDIGFSVSSIDLNRSESYGTFGGLLFMGTFFAILFLTNTVLIIYFKQVSEGYDDRERFVILQKVGMSDEEVRQTINRQVLIVFFLPVVIAFCHVLAACNIMVQILKAFVMTNVGSCSSLYCGHLCYICACVYFCFSYYRKDILPIGKMGIKKCDSTFSSEKK